MDHSCIKYVLALLKQIAGENAYCMAVSKLNSKYKQDDDQRNVSSKGKDQDSGTLESIFSQQIEVFSNSMQQHLKSFVSRTEKVEESFLDKLDIAGRHNFTIQDPLDKYGKNRHSLPQTINLPDLPLVRVQDRRHLDSTNSSSETINSAKERSNFERRRRTHNNTTNMMNDATDQKIPSIDVIRPIPDETEEFNLKGSISVSVDNERDNNDHKGIRSGERILVQHNGEKTNLRDRVQRSLESSIKPAEMDLA